MGFFDFLDPGKQLQTFTGPISGGAGGFDPFGGGGGSPFSGLPGMGGNGGSPFSGLPGMGGGGASNSGVPSQATATPGMANGGIQYGLPTGGGAPSIGGGAGYTGSTGGGGGFDPSSIFGGGGGGGMFGGGGSPVSMLSGMLGLTVEPTAGRNLYGEGYNTLAAQSYLAGPQLNLESYYRPQFAGLERGIYDKSLGGFFGQVPGYQQSIDPQNSALYNEMNNQALSELQLGASLDPSLRREVQQSARAGQSARGLGYGPTDVYEEAMQTGAAGQALRNQRRQFAGNVAQANLQRDQPYYGLASQGAGYAQQGGANVFNPWSPYSQDLYNTNYNSEVARKIATAQANAAVLAGAVQMASNIL